MILFVEPVSNNIGMYVPAYPLPLMEIASFLKAHEPEIEVRIISLPVQYGLPLTGDATERTYRNFLVDLARMDPAAVGISCTAISQAGETVRLCEQIKSRHPDILTFVGGYFPTMYPEEIFARTSAVDLIVVGEGEEPALQLARVLKRGGDPRREAIPGLMWQGRERIHGTPVTRQFDLNRKVPLNPMLLDEPDDYGVLPYAFSRGCPFHCNFCMEDRMRKGRREVAAETVLQDLKTMSRGGGTKSLMVADALFQSFHLIPHIRSVGARINFETRCDTLNPAVLPELADICGIMALGLESASYESLRRMNKVTSRSHYEHYISNAETIFRTASRLNIPLMVFMIAGYPGDTEEDLQASLAFAGRLAACGGPGGHIFKVGECRVYPKTRIYNMAKGMADVVFDDDGVFGSNVVRQPSAGVDFATVLGYMNGIFQLSNPTEKIRDNLMRIMPFFRLPSSALTDEIVPSQCFRDTDRSIFNTRGESLVDFRGVAPALLKKFHASMSGERASRSLSL